MKRRICLFCETWESGGIESFLYNVLKRIDRNTLEIDLVTAELRNSIFTKDLEDTGVHLVELSGNVKNVRKNHMLFRHLLLERNYDVIHVNAFQGMTLFYLHIAKMAGVPVRLAHSHNTDLRKSWGRPVKLMLHRLYRRLYTKDATELWACSKAAAGFLFDQQALDQRGYRFIPNGIDVDRFRFSLEVRKHVRNELGIADKLVIGHVGRLCYQKNQAFLLEVLAALDRPNAVLLLVGEGEDRGILEKRAYELGISDRVIFYGTTKRVEELFWGMDVFAFPSLFEGFGIVAIEAQAAGLPVLCSEAVPEEAAVTSSFVRTPLSLGPEGWKHAVKSAENTHIDRSKAAEQVRAAGYDIMDVAAAMEQRYQGVKV